MLMKLFKSLKEESPDQKWKACPKPMRTLVKAGDEQLHKLEEFHRQAYETSGNYEEKTKASHNKKNLRQDLQPGQQVLPYNLRLKLFTGKLKSKWWRSFRVVQVSPFGVVTLRNEKEQHEFKVIGHMLKIYLGGTTN